MTPRTSIPFVFAGCDWSLHVYETRDRHGDEATRVAAYCLADSAPRGPRRAWTLEHGRLVPWEPRTEGDWPELDEAAAKAMNGASAAVDAERRDP